jgi:urate oxidase
VKGVLSITTNSRKRFFQLSAKNHQLSKKENNINKLTKHFSAKKRAKHKTKGNKHTTHTLIHRLTQRLTTKPPTQHPAKRQNPTSVSQQYHNGIAEVGKERQKG